jgi:two-component system, LytTR family, response regulator LytT
MKLKVFIIDDEAPARRELRFFLEQHGEVEIVGEASNGTAAFKGIRESKPDLVFLDIQMPGMSGIELAMFLCELPEKPMLVFATAYDGYAIQAFEVDAIDYLCKPFTAERLAKSVAKATRILLADPAHSKQVSPLQREFCRKIPLYRGESIIPTSPDRIVLFHSEEGEVLVNSLDGKFRTKFTLNDLELKLSSSGFIRPHRSFLININHVREVIPWFNGSYKLIMNDRNSTEVPVSRYNVKDLKKHFDI